MKHIIITGASKGLGKALAQELTVGSTTTSLISRDLKKLDDLSRFIRQKGLKTYIYNYDLINYNKTADLVSEIISTIDLKICQSIVLINNASVINPINQFDSLDVEDLEINLKINCMAPILLMNQFLRKTKHLNIERKIINISSGVVDKPIYGWSSYSASKSAVNSVIETISIENEGNDLLKVVSFDPGVMDTDMQQDIRRVSKSQFKDVETFKKFHENNKLTNSKNVAEIIKKVYVDDWCATHTFEKIGEYIENR